MTAAVPQKLTERVVAAHRVKAKGSESPNKPQRSKRRERLEASPRGVNIVSGEEVSGAREEVLRNKEVDECRVTKVNDRMTNAEGSSTSW